MSRIGAESAPRSAECVRMAEVAREVVARLPDDDVYAAFVFGSVAWGDADRASDVDVTLCLDRPNDYREVSRVRVADVIGRPCPDGPLFADVDRIAWPRFFVAVTGGAWHQRVVHSIVVADTDGAYAHLRDRVTAAFLAPESRRARAAARRDLCLGYVEAARQLVDADRTLAALHARLGLEAAAAAVLDAFGGRYSASHFLDGARRALDMIGRDDLHARLLRGLGLDSPDDAGVGKAVGAEAADRGMRAFHAFAEALRGWVAEPAVAAAMPAEDRAWAAFTYADETYEEVGHKLAVLRETGRYAEMAAYVDGLLVTPIRMNAGKILNLRGKGVVERPSTIEFHEMLRSEPLLFKEWAVGLRLHQERHDVLEAAVLILELLDTLDPVSRLRVT
ncbi:nucleotidyltransferase domain-containing protein [Actinopolymorpha sp. B11F2]|uniref:nucleotidyltransferase domain-containing protein n=1 Tax=Actinopolymorpha sp. B11F2 TaxID=3160862 RepID=UPI0032E37ABE